jgi:hypothetical protein
MTATICEKHDPAIPRPVHQRRYISPLADAPKVLAEIAYVLHLTRQIREEIVRERSSPLAPST